MTYKVVIPAWDSGLNELLHSQEKRYDPRTRRMRVYNTEKTKNERLIRKCLVEQGLKEVKINPPVEIKYTVYAKDKKHDRMNLGSCLDKCFCDALQTLGMLSNDGWNDIVNISFEYFIDRQNPRAEIEIREIKRGKREEK